MLTIDTPTLSEPQFNKICKMVKDHCGLNLRDGKQELVKSRLSKRLRKLGFSNYRQYIDYVREDSSGEEFVVMLDALSTNLTSFFRESDHFDYLTDKLVPRLIARASRTDRRIRIWSAGCSSGEEPYTIAICLATGIADLRFWDAKILATDIAPSVLERASEGVYGAEHVKTVPPLQRAKYFQCFRTRPDRLYRINHELRKLVSFTRLNLMASWPMSGPFDAIFCRNVMIYFDKAVQQKLIDRYTKLLSPGGTLFIGHSESLAGITHQLRYVQPTVYEKS